MAVASIFTLCLFGQILTDQSEDAQYALYELPWFLLSKKQTTNLMIMHMRMSRPVVYTANFFTMSLDTFINVSI